MCCFCPAKIRNSSRFRIAFPFFYRIFGKIIFLTMKHILRILLAVVLVLAACTPRSSRNNAYPVTTNGYIVAAYVWPSCHDDSLAHAYLWGEGEGEWEVIKKGNPRFPGHYQPKLPADLGFYDLRVPEVRREQARMAKENGIAAHRDSPAGSPENGSCHVTDEKGRFLLKAGQKAVFIGIIPGTRFNVREEASFGFTQITPESADGYRDRIVSESPQTLLFENIRAPGLLLPDAGGQGIWISLLLSGLLCCVLLLFFCRGFRTAEAAGRKRSFRSGQPVCRRKRQCFGTGPEQGEIRTAGSAEKTLSGKRAWPEKAPDSGNSRGNRKRGDRRHEK